MLAAQGPAHGHDFGERARLCKVSHTGMCDDNGWDIVPELVALTEQKETEVFAAIFAQRQQQFLQMSRRCRAVQTQIAQQIERGNQGLQWLEAHPAEQSRISAMQAQHGRSHPSCRGSPAWDTGTAEVGAHAAAMVVGGQIVEGGLVPQGSSNVSEHGHGAWLRDPELAKEVLRSLRERDQLLSMGLSWLATEIDDAQEHVRQLSGAPAFSLHPSCMTAAFSSMHSQAEQLHNGSGEVRRRALEAGPPVWQHHTAAAVEQKPARCGGRRSLSSGALHGGLLDGTSQGDTDGHSRAPGGRRHATSGGASHSGLLDGLSRGDAGGQPRAPAGVGQLHEGIRRVGRFSRCDSGVEPARFRALDAEPSFDRRTTWEPTWEPLSSMFQQVRATQNQLVKQAWHGCAPQEHVPGDARHAGV